MLAIKEIPTTEGRNAELALWRRRPDDAERILLQAKLPPPVLTGHAASLLPY